MGVVRRLPVDKNIIYDYIPVDVVVNECILAGWHVATTRLKQVLKSLEVKLSRFSFIKFFFHFYRPKDVSVFHCTSSTYKPFSWNQVEHKVNSLLNLYPLKKAVWYPTLKLLPSFTLFRISTLFFHFLPGLFFDTLLRISGEKPRYVNNNYSESWFWKMIPLSRDCCMQLS